MFLEPLAVPLSPEPLEVNGCWERGIVFHQWCKCPHVAHVRISNFTVLMQATVVRLTGCHSFSCVNNQKRHEGGSCMWWLVLIISATTQNHLGDEPSGVGSLSTLLDSGLI